MFCENCKQFATNGDAKYCAECGTKLIDTHNIFLENENLTLQWLAQFLKETLGYAVVKEINNNTIQAQYRTETQHAFDTIVLYKEDNFISFCTFAPLTRCVTEDLRFYKALNEANKNLTIFYLYSEPKGQEEQEEKDEEEGVQEHQEDEEDTISESDEDDEISDDFGNVEVFHQVHLDSNVPLHVLYCLAQGYFERSIFQTCIDVGLYIYLPCHRVVDGPFYLKKQNKIVQVVKYHNEPKEIQVFVGGTSGFRLVTEEDNIVPEDLQSAPKIPLKVLFSFLNENQQPQE